MEHAKSCDDDDDSCHVICITHFVLIEMLDKVIYKVMVQANLLNIPLVMKRHHED